MWSSRPATSDAGGDRRTASITITGNNSRRASYVTANGGVRRGRSACRRDHRTADGVGAKGLVIDGNVGGTVNISSTVNAAPGISQHYATDDTVLFDPVQSRSARAGWPGGQRRRQHRPRPYPERAAVAA